MDWVNTSPLVKRYTFEEFCELSEPPDYSKVELIGGILYLTPRPRLDGTYHTTADLVVEVMSVESAVYDRNTKADTYTALNIKELWLIDLSSGIVEFRVLEDIQKSNLFGLNDRFKSTVVPDFDCTVREVFED